MGDAIDLPAPWRHADDRRRVGRLEVRHLRTRLGRVADIGPGGMRVCGPPWPPIREYGAFDVDLLGLTEIIPLRVRVVWQCRTALLRRDVGLAFEGLSEHAEHALSGLFAACRDIRERREAG